MLADLLHRKQTHFILWRPGKVQPPPCLFIGQISASESPYQDFQEIPLQQNGDFPELWQIAATDCKLENGKVYFYWFKVSDANVHDEINASLYCTDPTAWTVDRRFFPPTASPEDSINRHPASVILYEDGKLIPCDSQGEKVTWEEDVSPNALPSNNQLVIYKLPTTWTETNQEEDVTFTEASFQDVLGLLVKQKTFPNFTALSGLESFAYLAKLGINALELLLPEDSCDRGKRQSSPEWRNSQEGTSNYFAADFQLGFPHSQDSPTPTTDLATLIQTCHSQGVRFFLDVAMAYSRENPYRYINYLDFYVQWNSGDPEQGDRVPHGGDLFKYNYWVEDYHPITGEKAWFVPAREYMKLHLSHWIHHYAIDGLTFNEIGNINNYDFVEECKDFSRTLWEEKGGGEKHFLVVGKQRSTSIALIHQNRVNSLENHNFKRILRKVVLGQNAGSDSSFEWSVRKLIDCRFLGFTDGAQATNYVTSTNVRGAGNERLYNYLLNNGVYDTEARIKLAFVCLLTAVGIPMIVAGEEFGDEEELDEGGNAKIDPVNYSRMEDDWRSRIYEYVARLVHFRTTSKALAINDTDFIHADFHEDKRVVVWTRGRGKDIVVVVANFSDYGTPNPLNPETEYVVANFPKAPKGKYWHEVTQDRMVLPEWVGREPIFPWEAKVYTLV